MAISGAGGWIPSAGVYVRNRVLVRQPIVQNKPREIVLDAQQAASALIAEPNGTVQLDMRGWNFSELHRLLREAGICA